MTDTTAEFVLTGEADREIPLVAGLRRDAEHAA